jgi:hypothetical protein
LNNGNRTYGWNESDRTASLSIWDDANRLVWYTYYIGAWHWDYTTWYGTPIVNWMYDLLIDPKIDTPGNLGLTVHRETFDNSCVH